MGAIIGIGSYKDRDCLLKSIETSTGILHLDYQHNKKSLFSECAGSANGVKLSETNGYIEHKVWFLTRLSFRKET